MTRNRRGILESVVTLGALVLLGFGAYRLNLSGNASEELQIDLVELLGLCVALMAGFTFLAWRRVAEQERELGRRIKAEQEARHLAHHDHLTGLPNRRQLAEALDAAVSIPPSAERVHALLVLDLNGFKRVNDLFGHPAGDAVLSVVSQRIKGALRDGDLLTRSGGDEFSIVAREVQGAEGATSLAGRIIAALEQPVAVGTDLHPVGSAIGIALVPHDGRDVRELQRKADVALYHAKSRGGSVSAFFDEAMDRAARERDVLQRELAQAVALDAIVPFYQPIVDLPLGHVRGFEALARWTHPELGEVPPERFIPVAEECGLIGLLTRQLFARAAADAASWPDPTGLSFNLSPILLHDEDLADWLLAAANEAGLQVNRIEIEITENAVVRDLDAAKHALGRLRDAGIRIALDDFGTGASSLFHLRSLKFDTIKIDRSFVANMSTERESAAILRALVGLGLGLGVEVIAEGIERADQCAQLIGQGCSEGQGFLYGRAVPAAEALQLLQATPVA